jgi:hypothetical protein
MVNLVYRLCLDCDKVLVREVEMRVYRRTKCCKGILKSCSFVLGLVDSSGPCQRKVDGLKHRSY